MTAQVPDSPPVDDDLNDAERALLKAAAVGTVVDLRTGDAALDSPANAADWNDDRNVRAGFLADLLTGDQPTESGRLKFVKLRGACITGAFDMEARKLLCPVLLQDCCFDEAINLDEVEAVSIRLPGCHVLDLNAKQLRAVGSMEINDGFTAHGEIRLLGAHIGGQLDLRGASLTNDNGPALNADTLTVGGHMLCHDGFTAHGEIRLLGAHIGGRLDLRGASLTNDNGYALSADTLTVGGHMLCRDGLTVKGEIRLVSAHIGAQLDLSGANLTAIKGGHALAADNLAVVQSMLCRDGFTAHGGIRLLGARIGGQLNFSGASLTNDNGPALNAASLTVDQGMLCNDGLTVKGEIRLLAARIGGHLDLRGATIANANGDALNAYGLTIDQSMFCSGNFTAHGVISLRGAHIGGSLDLRGATLTANKDGYALHADGLTIDHTMYCDDGFTAQGETRLIGAHVGGQLSFRGASLANNNGPALNAVELTVGQSMFCNNGFTAQGGVNLTNVKVGMFYDDKDSWPDNLWIRGFTYEGLENQSVGTRARLQWLRRHDGPFTPQIYDQLADVYRRAGDDGAARKVAVAKQWRRRKPYNPLSWLWWVTVGYGYRTWQAFIWAAVLAVVGALVFSGAYPAHMIPHIANPPRFQPVIYALDVLLPIGGLGQKSAWQATGAYLDWYWGLAIAGWVLSAAVVAGLTGILKRD